MLAPHRTSWQSSRAQRRHSNTPRTCTLPSERPGRITSSARVNTTGMGRNSIQGWPRQRLAAALPLRLGLLLKTSPLAKFCDSLQGIGMRKRFIAVPSAMSTVNRAHVHSFPKIFQRSCQEDSIQQPRRETIKIGVIYSLSLSGAACSRRVPQTFGTLRVPGGSQECSTCTPAQHQGGALSNNR